MKNKTLAVVLLSILALLGIAVGVGVSNRNAWEAACIEHGGVPVSIRTTKLCFTKGVLVELPD